MKILILCLLIVQTSFAFGDSYEQAKDILQRLETETSIQKRLDGFSKSFLGLPYGKNGPLGEGPSGRYDQDPLYRFDTFDCTTYVETILALGLAQSAKEFEEILDGIRYEDGVIDYLHRNHFTDLQWIPSNVKNGVLEEINDEIVGPRLMKIAEAQINFPGWIRSHKLSQIIIPLASDTERLTLLEELRMLANNFSVAIARVPYVEITTILRDPTILRRIPHGTVVNFVRPNWDLTEVAGTHQNISHQGFLFRKGNVVYLRHASTAGAVLEEPFIDYIKKFENHPTLKGVHFMRVTKTHL